MQADKIEFRVFLCTLFLLFSGVAQEKLVEYSKGTLPIIITAPHGGRIQPANMPDRTSGVTVTDSNTDLLARAIFKQFEEETGATPHMIICNVKRSKLDCNRPLKEACDEKSPAVDSWKEFHKSVSEAAEAVKKSGKKYLLIDLHGHGHEIQRLELGYLISANDLRIEGSDFEKLEAKSSVKGLKFLPGSNFNELIRGPSSLGSLFEKADFSSVPSLHFAEPGKGNKYFSGGFITREYGSQSSQNFAVQLETYSKGVRDSKESRKKFAVAFVAVITEFVNKHLK